MVNAELYFRTKMPHSYIEQFDRFQQIVAQLLEDHAPKYCLTKAHSGVGGGDGWYRGVPVEIKQDALERGDYPSDRHQWVGFLKLAESSITFSFYDEDGNGSPKTWSISDPQLVSQLTEMIKELP